MRGPFYPMRKTKTKVKAGRKRTCAKGKQRKRKQAAPVLGFVEVPRAVTAVTAATISQKEET